MREFAYMLFRLLPTRWESSAADDRSMHTEFRMQLHPIPRPPELPVGARRPASRRLRRPVPEPSLSTRGGWSNYLARLSWLFS